MIYIDGRFLTQQMTGVQRFAYEISRRIKEIMGEQVILVCPSNLVMRDEARELNAQIIGKHKGHVWEQFDLPRFLKKQGSPLLLCLCNVAPLFYKNKVVTIHDVAFEVFPQTFSRSFLCYYKFLIPRIVRSSRLVATVSIFSKSELIRCYKIDEKRIIVVYNAVNERFRYVEDLNLKKNQYFLAVSSLNYRKNFFAVLKAFDLYSQQNASCNLYIIGDLQSRSFGDVNIDEYRSNPRIKFLGRVSDEELIRYYSNAIGFIYPSFYEGFGIPLLEAQKCDCPVLCSDIPVFHEVCGDSVLYCDANNPEGMSVMMESMLKEREMLQEKGRQNVKRFSWIISSGRFVDILKRL